MCDIFHINWAELKLEPNCFFRSQIDNSSCIFIHPRPWAFTSFSSPHPRHHSFTLPLFWPGSLDNRGKEEMSGQDFNVETSKIQIVLLLQFYPSPWYKVPTWKIHIYLEGRTLHPLKGSLPNRGNFWHFYCVWYIDQTSSISFTHPLSLIN